MRVIEPIVIMSVPDLRIPYTYSQTLIKTTHVTHNKNKCIWSVALDKYHINYQVLSRWYYIPKLL